MHNLIKLAIAGTAMTLAAVSATAAPVTFFGEDLNTAGDPSQVTPTNSNAARASFFANLIGVGTETFEGFANGTASPLPVSFGAAGTATLNGNFNVQSGNDGAGRYAISGDKYWYAGAGSFDVTFSAPVAAFGFYGIDIGDFGGQLSLQLTDSANNVTNLIVPDTIGGGGSTSGSVLYFGFFDTTTSYTKVAFFNSTGGDNFAFDDFSIGSREQVNPTVPEPATWALMIAGFGLVGTAMRRRTAALAA